MPTFILGANMHKAIIACFAIAFLTSPLHAESAGSAALKGGAKGAGGGGGWTQPPFGPDKQKTANKNSDQTRSLLIKPTTTKPTTSGSQQMKGRQ
jgi:hypothetical protein